MKLCIKSIKNKPKTKLCMLSPKIKVYSCNSCVNVLILQILYKDAMPYNARLKCVNTFIPTARNTFTGNNVALYLNKVVCPYL